MAAKRGDLYSLGATVIMLVLMMAWGRTHLQAQSASPSPIFRAQQFGVIPRPTPTPTRRVAAEPEEEAKPIPRSWVIGGAIAAVVALGGLSYLATRVWRSSNLFDREYRFPVTRDAAIRLGAERCGGHMAVVQFGKPRSKTKDV